jgi:hypothetical protein
VTPQETLKAAAEYISGHGWTQDRMEGRDGSTCALGAILNACYGDEDAYGQAVARLNRHIRSHVAISDWNDAPGRTAEEVILTLKRAAEEL